MRPTPRPLPVIASCDGCGACCRVVTSPPFLRRTVDDGAEDVWERLRWERPDLVAEILADEAARRARGDPSFGTPCLWLDLESGRCRHYEERPRACRADSGRHCPGTSAFGD